MSAFSNKDGVAAAEALVAAIRKNKEYLSEIDGAIGDGDHGVNMNKGFTLFKEGFDPASGDLGQALKALGRVLLTEIGGSMGPIYGTFFREMSKAMAGRDAIDAAVFAAMLRAAVSGVESLGEARVGDKTMLDTLIPGTEAFEKSLAGGADFPACLDAMEKAAKAGWESTKDMEAKIGRASRLGKRSVGVLDAGATSCWLILKAFSDSIRPLLR
ncbi:MAG: dihydroxyacetone kinase subunit L [Planctomycetota bacterium]|jgi:dihydroxyacetone kinase-like protein|nr:dihydroxyacetone kinase subunit L [Planctomycetota bacterium]